MLVVACSQRKRVAIPHELQLRSLNGPPTGRSLAWQTRLQRVAVPQIPAADLYAGDHWQAALAAFTAAKRYSPRAELWVISAGYGLVPAEMQLKPYSATFASGGSDSVWRGPSDGARTSFLQTWWNGLANGTSLADLAPLNGDGVLLLAAGASYVEAVMCDLERVREHTPTQLSVIAAGARNLAPALPVRSRFRALVGGTDASVNTRVLAWLAGTAAEHRFEHAAMAASLTRATARLPEVRRPRGRSAADPEISRHIRLLRKETPALSRTRALRELRSHGIACEQGRFARIWDSPPTSR